MRLVDMKIEPFLLASTIEGVVAQRLIRVLCPRCKEEYQPEVSELLQVGLKEDAGKDMKFYRAVGCPFCRGGYKGRVGMFEVLMPNEDFWTAVLTGKPLGEIRDIAVNSCGMRTLLSDGLSKIHEGITSIEEVAKEVHGY